MPIQTTRSYDVPSVEDMVKLILQVTGLGFPNERKESPEYRRFRRTLNVLLEQIKLHKHARIFEKPITSPEYLTVVKRPMDLTTIKKKLDSGQIRTVDAFERDLLLMFANAIMYNSESSQTFRMTKEMQLDVSNLLMDYKVTYGVIPK